jgi:PhnB protein
METKTKKVKPIPEGMCSITPFLLVNDAAGLLEFLKKAFGGQPTYELKAEEKVMHATVKIGNSILMVADVPAPYSPMPCQLYLYVEDIDAVYKKALAAGGASVREPITEFYGDRSAALLDAWGNKWWIATRVEDISEEELIIREKEARKKKDGQKK